MLIAGVVVLVVGGGDGVVVDTEFVVVYNNREDDNDIDIESDIVVVGDNDFDGCVKEDGRRR